MRTLCKRCITATIANLRVIIVLILCLLAKLYLCLIGSCALKIELGSSSEINMYHGQGYLMITVTACCHMLMGRIYTIATNTAIKNIMLMVIEINCSFFASSYSFIYGLYTLG